MAEGLRHVPGPQKGRSSVPVVAASSPVIALSGTDTMGHYRHLPPSDAPAKTGRAAGASTVRGRSCGCVQQKGVYCVDTPMFCPLRAEPVGLPRMRLCPSWVRPFCTMHTWPSCCVFCATIGAHSSKRPTFRSGCARFTIRGSKIARMTGTGTSGTPRSGSDIKTLGNIQGLVLLFRNTIVPCLHTSDCCLRLLLPTTTKPTLLRFSYLLSSLHILLTSAISNPCTTLPAANCLST